MGRWPEIVGTPTIISASNVDDALADGQLVAILPHRWAQLTGGKPLVATAPVADSISLAGIMELWDAYVGWRRDTMPGLPEDERLFTGQMNGRDVWVIEDAAAFTVLYPEDD